MRASPPGHPGLDGGFMGHRSACKTSAVGSARALHIAAPSTYPSKAMPCDLGAKLPTFDAAHAPARHLLFSCTAPCRCAGRKPRLGRMRGAEEQASCSGRGGEPLEAFSANSVCSHAAARRAPAARVGGQMWPPGPCSTDSICVPGGEPTIQRFYKGAMPLCQGLRSSGRLHLALLLALLALMPAPSGAQTINCPLISVAARPEL